ncbi:MAG TPA: HDIG domain-containing protein [Candidatus Sulfotelmatobacter sp.]|nr:HDIG domain-containing protein [Candidatus Sulfotelmatobacter sp.]
MIARRVSRAAAFTRRDAVRLVVSGAILAAIVTAILSIDLLPSPAFQATVDQPAPVDVYAPRAVEYTSALQTAAQQQAARAAVAPQYDYTPASGQAFAAQQVAALQREVAPIDAAFGANLTADARQAALAAALPDLSAASRTTLLDLDASSWTALRSQMITTLEEAQSVEVRDTLLPTARAALGQRLPTSLPADQRALATEILTPLLVADSGYDQAATTAAQDAAAAAVPPVVVHVAKGELVVLKGARLSAADVEELDALGVNGQPTDTYRVGGWFILAILVIGTLLAWLWRFRPELWHRTNTLVLLGLLLIAATAGLELTATRSILPFFLPLAAIGILTAILLDAGTATILTALVAVMAAVVVFSVELGVYTLLGGLAGIIAVRRGERVQQFIQAAIVMAVVNVLVVAIFGLLGQHDLTGTLQLWGAAFVGAGGSAVAAAGTFAGLGNVFGITTAFQLLELGNPSQPLLRRLLLDAPGTYHHSLMVGNLAERAAEAIDADPLVVRVAALYHDIGKLGDPNAFIENQAGRENIHDDLEPAQSAALIKSHVANGIDLAYQYHLPKALIAFIPQHHGTALMSFFLDKARQQAVEETGLRPGSPEAEAAAAGIDELRFRHSGPRPQTREAAILMLADSVEASVRSLDSHDEPAVRAMVDRIILERLQDGQFDECDLTLRDLERVREAFVQQLLGMYHRRIAYPQNKIVELESRRAAGGGRGA